MNRYTLHHPDLTRYGIRSVVGDLFFPVLTGFILFAAAGNCDWWWGWIFALLYFAAFLTMDAILIWRNPELLNERGRRKPGYSRVGLDFVDPGCDCVVADSSFSRAGQALWLVTACFRCCAAAGHIFLVGIVRIVTPA